MDALGHEPTTAARPPTAGTALRLGWVLAILGMPFYVFLSGRPQPADFALVLLASVPAVTIGAQLGGWLRIAATRAATFVALVAVVNLAWTVIAGSTDFLVATLFYAFNLTVFVGTMAQMDRHGESLIRTIGLAAAASLAMEVALALVFPNLTVGRRLCLYFNNPNQLAYYALGAATVVMLASNGARIPRWVLFGSLLSAAYLTYQTYSRAAALGVLALLGIAVSRRPWIAVALALPALVAAASADLSFEANSYWEMRMDQALAGGTDEYLEDRGLERVVHNPEFLLFGAGEGEHQRFHPLGLELHSSFANVAFSYGIFGVLTFAFLLASTLQAGPARISLLLGPALFYGLFHNGLRFRIFWLVLAVAVVVAARAARVSSSPPGLQA